MSLGELSRLPSNCLGQDFEFAGAVRAHHTPPFALATVEPAVRVEGVAVGAVRFLAEYVVTPALVNFMIFDAGMSLNSTYPSRDHTGPSVN